jgi:hypothetical protein
MRVGVMASLTCTYKERTHHVMDLVQRAALLFQNFFNSDAFTAAYLL